MVCAIRVSVVLGINTYVGWEGRTRVDLTSRTVWREGFLGFARTVWREGFSGECGSMDRGVMWFYGVERIDGFLVPRECWVLWFRGFVWFPPVLWSRRFCGVDRVEG